MKNIKRSKILSNLSSDIERAFYASKDIEFYNVFIGGKGDGESAFKESSNITIKNSNFKLRYPFWHCENIYVIDSKFDTDVRAAFWYDKNIQFECVNFDGVKVFRESSNIDVLDSIIVSDEPFWRCCKLFINNCQLIGVYAFFESNDVTINNLKFKGKYSFQYMNNLEVSNSEFDTKDAFWHSKNVIVRDSTIKGEYLGWYSENLTLIDCYITGTQPLCYCKNLKLVNCKFENADLAFEYSEVNGNITGKIDSIKNPQKGILRIDHDTLFIVDENDRSNGEFKLIK